MPARHSLIGRTFGRLKVISEGFTQASGGRYTGICACACGNTVTVQNNHLKSGHTKSCGCIPREMVIIRSTKHGMAGTRIYQIWGGMIDRCSNPDSEAWENYGGRGIKVCERWKKFDEFFKYMGEGKRGWSIERLDNNGDYSPDNVVWANRTQQNRNTRCNRIVTVKGITGCIAVLCERFHIHRSVVHNRMKRGWAIEDAFLKPIQNSKFISRKA